MPNEFSHRTIIVVIQKRFLAIFKWVYIARILITMVVGKLKGNVLGRHLFLKQTSGWAIGIYTGTSPLQLHSSQSIHNPVLKASDVTDASAAFVADPFLMKKDSFWYMFFEVFNMGSRQGEIGLATSMDGLQWTYKQIVLREPFHLSYPYVFEWDGEYFMIPESSEYNAIRLYKAVHFPTAWVLINTLMHGRYVDTSLLRYNGQWWMFTTNKERNDTLYCYYANTLIGPWISHPKNPIVQGNARIARSGGRVILFDERIIRYSQDCITSYGNKVRAFVITTLTTTRYEEHEVSESPIIKASGIGWNKKGMHTVDPHEIGEHHWIAAVDGYEKDLLLVGY